MVRGEVPVLQVLMENDRPYRLYRGGVGFDVVYEQFSMLIEQMIHEHPGLRVLEIGSGTGGTSAVAIKAASPHLVSYTYTDNSPAFFEKAKTRFTLDEACWDELMQGAGFPSVDVSCSDLGNFDGIVMSTQAVDDRITLLREPVSINNRDQASVSTAASTITSFVVVGGKTRAVSRVTQTIRRLLRLLGFDIILVPDIADILHVELVDAAVLCLVDLDEPIFKDTTEPKFRGMENTMLNLAAFLWVTKNRRTSKFYSNMVVGMACTIAFESPYLVMQFLDVEAFVGRFGSQDATEATFFTEALLRLVYLSSPNFADVFWVRETEMRIENGLVSVPRIMGDDELNDRLNADRRPLFPGC
ncbi:hypothetical protein SEUCBS139899_006270 [Sporothrix eucalyptigena]|uniref:Uncharacterized protein n=1 Tax=Sporothrix eucalyptigena TaxID=1812306 RepID=A0ABP0CL90_9PEZI